MVDSNEKEENHKNDHELLEIIHTQITKVAANMEHIQIADYVQLLNRPGRLIWTNLLFGISRGIGIALGFTVFATTIVYVLQFIGALNIPIIGNYIADIVRHVQSQLNRDGFY